VASVLGGFSEVDARKVAGRGQIKRACDGASVPSNVEDTLSIHGTLRESGALASVYAHGGASPGPDFVWEINGTAGDLLITGEAGFANFAALQVAGSRARAAPVVLYADSESGGRAVNVGRSYRRFALARAYFSWAAIQGRSRRPPHHFVAVAEQVP